MTFWLNCEGLFTWVGCWVAVALTNEPTAVPWFRRVVKLARPALSVVMSRSPMNCSPSPAPDGSGVWLAKNWMRIAVLGTEELKKVPEIWVCEAVAETALRDGGEKPRLPP